MLRGEYYMELVRRRSGVAGECTVTTLWLPIVYYLPLHVAACDLPALTPHGGDTKRGNLLPVPRARSEACPSRQWWVGKGTTLPSVQG